MRRDVEAAGTFTFQGDNSTSCLNTSKLLLLGGRVVEDFIYRMPGRNTRLVTFPTCVGTLPELAGWPPIGPPS